MTSLLAAFAFAQQDSGYRVAAVIDAASGSRALIEDASREQRWYRVGDELGELVISGIDADGIVVTSSAGEFRLDLKGDSTLIPAALGDPPPDNVARTFRYANLLSVLQSVEPQGNESLEHATTRTLNKALGLSENARITAIAGEPVANSREAHSRLMNYVGKNRQVDVSIQNDEMAMMYVLPGE